MKRVILVSSTAAFLQEGNAPCSHTLPPRTKQGIYGLTKVCQEVIAEQYHREAGLRVAILRVGYVIDGEKMLDKYGRKIKERSPLLADRRDIGEVARLCLECTNLAFETFHVMSTEESMTRYDVQYTCDRLGWKPRDNFKRLPRPER